MERKLLAFGPVVVVAVLLNVSLFQINHQRIFPSSAQYPGLKVHGDDSFLSQPNTNKDRHLCPQGYTYVSDIGNNDGSSKKGTEQLVPKVVYQTSKSRCVHPDITSLIKKWRDPINFPGYSYRFYDDAAMDAYLFDSERWREVFPSLHLALLCINEVHNPTMKADLWRYLVLWEHGGVYADIDVSPGNFSALSIGPDDDGFFYLENENGYIAQYFLAVSPRHPLMFYSVHAAVQNLLSSAKISRLDVERVTGFQAVADAMTVFTNNAMGGKALENDTYVGKGGRSIRVGGLLSQDRVVANGIGYTLEKKNKLYAAMNMAHYTKLTRLKKFGSCYNIMNATKTRTGFEHEGVKVELLNIPLKPPHVYFEDIDLRSEANISKQLIPKVLYQTSKSRYIHPDIARIINKWRNSDTFPGFSHFLYDDRAMDAFLFNKERWQGVFPSLHLALQCVKMVNNPTMKADLWRYLILWEYGGVYADIDTDPVNFSASHIRSDDDGLFYLQTKSRFIQQFFLAVSPRHPLMYFTVHAAVQKLLAAAQFSQQNLARATGPGAVKDAMTIFMNDTRAGSGIKIGRHVGLDGRSIRVGGLADQHVLGDPWFLPKKKRFWSEMNMTHFLELNVRKNFGSCYNMMNVTKTAKGFEYEGAKVNLLEIPLKKKDKR